MLPGEVAQGDVLKLPSQLLKPAKAAVDDQLKFVYEYLRVQVSHGLVSKGVRACFVGHL